jgi:hypothetical protein
MSPSVRRLLDEAKKLPKEDRDLLRAELDGLDDEASEQEVDAAWDDEIARRVQSIKDGTATLHDWDNVEREADRIVDE